MAQALSQRSTDDPLYDGGQGITSIYLSTTQNGIVDTQVSFSVDAVEVVDERWGDRASCQLAAGRWSSRGCLVPLGGYMLIQDRSEARFNGIKVPFTQEGNLFILFLPRAPIESQQNHYELDIAWQRADMELPPAPTPGDSGLPLYLLEIKAPAATIEYFSSNQAHIISKIQASVGVFGWSIPQIEIQADRINIYMQETGSDPVSISVLVVLAIIVALLVIAIGIVSYEWRLVKTSDNQTIQSGLQKDENSLATLKSVRDQIAAKGGDTSAIDQAILALTKPTDLPDSGFFGTGLNNTTLLLLAALFFLSRQK